jgi:hypothetical protein
MMATLVIDTIGQKVVPLSMVVCMVRLSAQRYVIEEAIS